MNTDKLNQIAHDLKSPLTAIMAVLQSPGELTDLKRNLAQKAIWRSLHLIETMIITEPSGLIPELNLNQLIYEVIEEKKLIYPDVKFIVKSESIEILKREHEAREIQRVLCNIIQNSIDVVRDKTNGKILINVKLRYSKIYVEVEDNGPGIPGHIRRKLGLQKISYMKENGKGIGLFNAKKIINSIGGRLMIHSRMNVGTRVRLVV